MWARHMEIAFALWLAASAFIFRHPDGSWLWWNDLGVAALILAIALACYAPRLRRAHLAHLLVAAWLIGLGWIRTRGEGAPASAQNHLVIGLLLGMFAIIPSQANRPPEGWRRFYTEDDEGA